MFNFKGIMKIFFISLAITFNVISCNNTEKKDPLPATKATPSLKTSFLGSWRLADIEVAGTKNNDPLLETADDKRVLQQGLIFSFFENGIFTNINGLGNYDFGEWNFVNGKKMVFLQSKKYKDTFKIKADFSNSKELLILKQGNNQKMTFSRTGNAVEKFELDAFYTNNNTWRIKPLKPETDKQIMERFANYVSHLAFILKNASDQKQTAVSFEFSQGIIQIYSGGIGIKSKEDVPETWINSYYSPKQAWQAYAMFESYLKTSKGYKGASTGEWYIDDYNILTSIYGDLKNGEFQGTAVN